MLSALEGNLEILSIKQARKRQQMYMRLIFSFTKRTTHANAMRHAYTALLFQDCKHIMGKKVFCFINVNDQTDLLNRLLILIVMQLLIECSIKTLNNYCKIVHYQKEGDGSP